MSEAESTPKTSAIFVRLTKDFPTGLPHRRAGIELSAGPQPVEVEVTDEQLALLQGDHYIEIVDDAEAQKWIDRLGEPALKTSSDVALEAEGNSEGRNYGDDNEPTETPEAKAAREAKEAEDAETARVAKEAADKEAERRATTPTVEELVADNKRDDLVAKATEAGVEGLNYDDKQATTKAVIAEAIVAKREATKTEE